MHMTIKTILSFSVVQKSFVAAWSKYRFGLFDETGYEVSDLYPLFYRNRTSVVPNSCTDIPIDGNFAEGCLESSDQCLPFQPGQNGVTSSMLFSTDATAFPAVSGFVHLTIQLVTAVMKI